MTIRPQPGPQEVFLGTAADFAIYGGAAGGGKSWALLAEPLRHLAVPGFGAVIFRRTCPQITNQGGLWDEAGALYPQLGGVASVGNLEYDWPSGARVSFRHLQHEQDKFAWQGAQIALLEFDELTHFTEGQFFYLLSRNRSTCGVRPYVRASTNPDPHSWVKGFLAPWLTHDHELHAESGELRWFVRDGGLITWYSQPGDVPEESRPFAKSVTFVRASIFDNQILLAKDPGYVANLRALNAIDRARLLDGDWDKVEEGDLFHRDKFPVISSRDLPECVLLSRRWDFAATAPKPGKDPDWTVGVLMGKTPDERYVILDVVRLRGSPAEVERVVRETAERDRKRFFGHVMIRIEQEPGSSGVFVADYFVRKLAGHDVRAVPATGSKLDRARPLASQAEVGNVLLVDAPWVHGFVNELVSFPTEGVHDDQVDAASGALADLCETYSAGAF